MLITFSCHARYFLCTVSLTSLTFENLGSFEEDCQVFCTLSFSLIISHSPLCLDSGYLFWGRTGGMYNSHHIVSSIQLSHDWWCYPDHLLKRDVARFLPGGLCFSLPFLHSSLRKEAKSVSAELALRGRRGFNSISLKGEYLHTLALNSSVSEICHFFPGLFIFSVIYFITICFIHC